MNHCSVELYVAGVLTGDRRIVGKAITLMESTRSQDKLLARELLCCLIPYTGGALRVGVSGSPGCGKSTLIESLGLHAVAHGARVAVLAVDPSSKTTGGSVLGDKTRMTQLAASSHAFIRPSPAGKTVGGMSRCSREVLVVLEASGYNLLLVETVGVGQNETSVAGMVDFFLLLTLPNAGDELQGIKRGIMEVAHAVIVNKADGSFQSAAEETARQIRSALHVLHHTHSDRLPVVLLASALEGMGLDKIWTVLQTFHSESITNGHLSQLRRSQSIQWMWERVWDRIDDSFQSNAQVQSLLPKLQQDVMMEKISPLDAADTLLDAFFGQVSQ